LLATVSACSGRIFYYSERGDIEGVKPYIEKGEIEQTDGNGFTPLLVATYYGHTGLVEYLVANGAEVDRQEDGGWTSLMYAAYYNYKEIAKILLEHHASLTIKNSEGKNALDIAEENDRESILRMMKKTAN
jgi:ankyrin repeat protein